MGRRGDCRTELVDWWATGVRRVTELTDTLIWWVDSGGGCSADGLIPVDHSLTLFKRCRARKLLITPPEMEHNSNLFGNANYLAIPAIHFFGFPGYYTATPPRLPASLFETPMRQHPLTGRSALGSKPLLCDCLAKRDPYGWDLGPQRAGDAPNNITVCFFKDDDPAEPLDSLQRMPAGDVSEVAELDATEAAEVSPAEPSVTPLNTAEFAESESLGT
ncbi:Alpha/beta hydrolase domain-containing protein 17B [Durusdinium trenchii]|uniref:Alpha/beta hydrolase domain-containing protein 17B n=1 Tax=Durusdinium trenchii TaxID=1381693 RepID=A0ABP0MX78_9DINO